MHTVIFLMDIPALYFSSIGSLDGSKRVLDFCENAQWALPSARAHACSSQSGTCMQTHSRLPGGTCQIVDNSCIRSASSPVTRENFRQHSYALYGVRTPRRRCSFVSPPMIALTSQNKDVVAITSLHIPNEEKEESEILRGCF